VQHLQTVVSGLRQAVRDGRDERDQTMVEYGVIVSFIAVLCVVALEAAGAPITSHFPSLVSGFTKP
jgi:Flp pilus assembly pilin Flp